MDGAAERETEAGRGGHAERDEDFDGIVDLAEEAVAEARAGARWVAANLRELTTAFGAPDVDGSDPGDP